MKQPFIYIGTDTKTVEVLSRSIQEILKSGMEQETLRTALDTLREATTVKDLMIQNCVFSTEGVKPKAKRGGK